MDHQRIGPYRVIRQLGQGGMGQVLEAVHEQIGRRAAIKVMHPELARHADLVGRFLNEARSVNVVRHPGIVEIIDFGQLPDGTPYLVMEFLEGESLFERLHHRGGRLPEREALGVARKMAQALTAAHEKGIIHRDLKPENVMLTALTSGDVGYRRRAASSESTEQVKLLDFGIAKLLYERDAAPAPDGTPGAASATTGSRLTKTDDTLGTLAFMAPEQIDNPAGVTDRADVFSLGVMIYEMISGRVPFEGMGALIAKPRPLQQLVPSVTRGTASLVGRMMARDPAARPSMAEVAEALSALLPREPLRLPPWALAAVAVAGVVALGGGYLGYRHLSARGRDQAPAVISLAGLRAEALAVLKEALRDPDPSLRLLGAGALGQTRDLQLAPVLLPLLGDADAAVQAQAAEALGQLGARGALPAVRALLDRTGAPGVGVAAAYALDLLGDDQGRARLRQALGDRNEPARLRAALVLCGQGDREAQELLRAWLRRPLPDEVAVTILGRLAQSGDGPARADLLGRLGRPGPPEMRLSVAASLARLGEGAGRAYLLETARRPGPGEHQLLAARLLASLGETAGAEPLRRVMREDRAPLSARLVAAEGLGECGQAEDAALLGRLLPRGAAPPRLQKVAAAAVLQLCGMDVAMLSERSLSWAKVGLGDESWVVREAAVAVLGDIAGSESVALLGQALRQDREPRVRRSAARALGRLREGGALLMLRAGLDDPDRGVRQEALRSLSRLAQTLQKLGEPAIIETIRGRLLELLAHSGLMEQVLASGTLLRLGDQDQRPFLRQQLGDKDPEVRKLVVEQAESDPEVLGTAVLDPEWIVRFAAARRLAAQGDRRAVPVLEEGLSKAGADGPVARSLLRRLGVPVPVPSVLPASAASADAPDPGALDPWAPMRGLDVEQRLAAVEALGDLSPAEVVAVLGRAVHDPEGAVRRRVAEAAAGLPGAAGPEGRPGLPILRALLADPDAAVSSLAAALLSASPSPSGASKAAAPAPSERGPRQAPPEDLRVAEAQSQAHPGPEPAPAGAGQEPPPAPLSAGPAPKAADADAPLVQIQKVAAEGLKSYARNDYRQARRLLERARSLCLRERQDCSALSYDLSYHLGRIYEAQGQLAEAMTEYERVLLPGARLRSAQRAAVKQAQDRLAGRLGRLRINKPLSGRCQVVEIWMPPGEHSVELGGGKSDVVRVRAGQTVQLDACP